MPPQTIYMRFPDASAELLQVSTLRTGKVSQQIVFHLQASSLSAGLEDRRSPPWIPD